LTEVHDVLVIGAGQAGLAAAYHLRRHGLEFAVLDAEPRVGDVWRRRWDSLRLFTPAAYDALPGMPFPATPDAFPTKEEMADYLQTYARTLDVPVRTACRVERLFREGEHYVVTAGANRLEARHVIVATGGHQTPKIPVMAEYRNPGQLADGDVLVVGAGNSGAEISMEAATAGHRTTLAGRSTGHIPGIAYARNGRPFMKVAERLLTLDTPIGRKLAPKVTGRGGPLIRIGPREIVAAGVRRAGRVTGAQDGMPQLEDGQILRASTVVWCTGFGHDFSWIELPILGPDGMPRHRRGVVESEPGLYVLGLPFLYGFTSALIAGAGRDAAFVVDEITARSRAGVRAGPPSV
jgi:putative flavoprotein involved in K+ transport